MELLLGTTPMNEAMGSCGHYEHYHHTMSKNVDISYLTLVGCRTTNLDCYNEPSITTMHGAKWCGTLDGCCRFEEC